MSRSGGPLHTALQAGEIELVGRIAWSSNAIFLVEVPEPSDGTDDDGTPDPLRGIYKPIQGERPLSDFPRGLGRRETAAWELSAVLGWRSVPETVMVDGPLGEGSVQRFIEVDYDDHYFTMMEEGDPFIIEQLKRICVFDLIANNTDRKGGHCLLDEDRHVWAIDNALTFHAQWKLRTVIWDFAGQDIDSELIEDIVALLDRGLPDTFAELLDPIECDALLTRASAVVADATFPHDPTGRRYPWPLV